MTAIEIIQNLMQETETSLAEIAEYGDLGTKENVHRMLHCNDLKVGAFVKMLEVLGYELIAQSTEPNGEELVVDYD